MIARLWRARAEPANADAYERLFVTSILPGIRRDHPGCAGGLLLRRPVDSGIEIVVITLWEDMEAIQRFAGRDERVAVVTGPAERLLSRADSSVQHFELRFARGVPPVP